MNDSMRRWLDGETDVMDRFAESSEEPYSTREEMKTRIRRMNRTIGGAGRTKRLVRLEQKGFYALYSAVAVVSCVLLIGVLLFTIANLPRYGEENEMTTEVVRRYVEKGTEETGAVNIVAGMILDYRAFDTLGESHVLFTALICVMILLRLDRKNMRSEYEDFYRIRGEHYFETSRDQIMKTVGMILLPCIFLYGAYILLNGQNSPGGGFSGGAVIGAGLILFAASFGIERVDRVLTKRRIGFITFAALSFYSFAKGYVFFTGANGIDSHIPKGKPGAILSGGLILPLDIAVGIVVACTMFGFYSLFRRGTIGGGEENAGAGEMCPAAEKGKEMP